MGATIWYTIFARVYIGKYFKEPRGQRSFLTEYKSKFVKIMPHRALGWAIIGKVILKCVYTGTIFNIIILENNA
jgi:hypothetical protein